MKNTTRFASAIIATLFVLGAQPLLVTAQAQQSERVSLDSVSKQLRTHSKPKKASTASMKSTSQSKAKARKEVPDIILPAAEASAAASAKRAPDTKAPLVPSVQRAGAKPKSKSSR